MYDKYRKCRSYRDRGELKTSVPSWGEVHFETIFLAPNNLLVRLMYGDKEKPIQTEIFWTNGTDYYTHTTGVSSKCVKLKEAVDFYAFGLGRLFDFEVPILLMPDSVDYTGGFARCEFEYCGETKQEKSIHLRSENASHEYAFAKAYDVSLDRKGFYLKSIKSTESYEDVPEKIKEPGERTLLSSMRSSFSGKAGTAPPKLLLLFGKPEVFPMQEVTTECIYHEVRFDEKIPPALFGFSPPAEL